MSKNKIIKKLANRQNTYMKKIILMLRFMDKSELPRLYGFIKELYFCD